MSQPALTKQIKQLEGRTLPLASPTATSTRPCCGCRSRDRTTCGSRCCSPSPAGSLSPPPTRSPPPIRSASASCGTSRSWPRPRKPASGAITTWPPPNARVTPVRIGAVTDQPDAYLTAIANGDGIALVPESASRYYARPGITYRPVTGVSPSQVGVAWAPANDANPVVQDFVRCSLDHKPPA